MQDIAGIPYVEASFDKNGQLQQQVTLPNGVTDLFVVSHGWNNNADEARGLYTRLFTSFVGVAQPNDLSGRMLAILGVIWPSKAFDELVAVAESGNASGGASLGGVSDAASQHALEDKIERMKAFFTTPAERQTLDEVRALVPDLEDKASARRAFVDKIRSLLDPAAANREDASDTFFKEDGNELMKNLKVDEADLEGDLQAAAGGASMMPGTGAGAVGVISGAAGLTSFLSGFKAAAMNVLNFTTYFEMKARAGTVGTVGAAPLIDRLAPAVARIHLVGHSFGGRLLSAAAANSTNTKIASMSLLQTAFSHNGFSQSKGGFFRSVVDRRRVNGPILVSHTKNDKAVGLAYPLASRISGDRAAAFGDENDDFGGLGRNGAQQMLSGETVIGKLLPVGSTYAFQAGKFFNLEASDFIKGHGDIAGKEVAYAIRRAIG